MFHTNRSLFASSAFSQQQQPQCQQRIVATTMQCECVFFSGKWSLPSSDYEGSLSEQLGCTVLTGFYSEISTPEGSWFSYAPTEEECEHIWGDGNCDQYTYSVAPDVVSRVLEGLELPVYRADEIVVVVGASQGGVLASEFALLNARQGVRVKLVLLSTSPRSHQLEEITDFIVRGDIELIATVGNWESYFGGLDAWWNHKTDHAIVTAITKRLNDIGGTVVGFNGGTAKSRSPLS